MEMGKKRILHLIDSGGMYGAENVIVNLSREMLDHSEYEPVVGCIVSSYKEKVDLIDIAKVHGIETHRFLIKNTLLFFHIPRTAKLLQSIGIDCVHCHGYKASVFAFFIRLMTDISIMSTCHLWFKGAGGSLKMRMMIALELYLYRFFPVIVGVSEDIITVLRKNGLPQKKLIVVKNGIVLSDYSEISDKLKKNLRCELGLHPGEICVLNVGRLTEQKAQETIIDAAKQFKRLKHKIRFFIIGDGELYDVLQDRIRDNDVADVVQLKGFREDIPSLLQIADIFVLPSIDEGMPMALLESVASRLPVVATPVGDVEKLISHNESGLIFKKNDIDGLVKAIDKLANDKILRRKLAQNAFGKIKDNYSSSCMYEQYQRIYKKILAG